MLFSIYSSAIKYNRSFIEIQGLVSDNQSKFKKKTQISNKQKHQKNYDKILCIFSDLKINDYRLNYMSLLIINQLLVNV